MRRLLPYLAALSTLALAAGCHSAPEGDSGPKISAPINNNDPAAKTAGAAPAPDYSANPSLPHPGGKRATAPQ